MKISELSVIRLNFSLCLADGTEVDSNMSQPPVEMKIGDGNMLPGFESHLLGMQAGEEKQVLVQAIDAFGEYNDENIQQFKRSSFSNDIDIVDGLVLSFADQSGAELPGVVKAVVDEMVHVDFNHPLAGRDIMFAIKIHQVTAA